MSKEKILIVDKEDKISGLEEKNMAHKEGKLHRAITGFYI